MTVHTRVSPVAEVLIICVWGRLARFGTTSERGGRAGGADFLGSSSRAVSAVYVCVGGAAKAAEPFKLVAQKQMGENAHEHTGMWTGMCLRMECRRCGFTCRRRGCHGQGLTGLFVSRQGPCMPPPACTWTLRHLSLVGSHLLPLVSQHRTNSGLVWYVIALHL